MFRQNMAIQVKKICPNSDLGYFPALAWPYFAFKGKIFKNTPVHFVDTINRSPNQNFVFGPPRKQIGLKFCRVASPENRKCLGASPENRKYLGTQKLGKGDTNEKKKTSSVSGIPLCARLFILLYVALHIGDYNLKTRFLIKHWRAL